MGFDHKDIRSGVKENIREYILSIGEPKYRAGQIEHCLWEKGVSSFEEMTELPLKLRARLAGDFDFYNATIERIQRSRDKTTKMLVRLHDGYFIETVIIPSDKKATACISSQIGCALGCRFCATSRLKYQRNLSVGEIYDQVKLSHSVVCNELGVRLSNLVFMGMGEPFLNYENVVIAIEKILMMKDLDLGPRKITISTAGISEKIKQLADDQINVELAVSLHSGNQEKRASIIPLAKKYPLKVLKPAVKYYCHKMNRKVTFEYLLLKDFNDQKEDTDSLHRFCRDIPCKVNLIPYNDTHFSDFKASADEQAVKFAGYLSEKGVNVRIRTRRGADIDAACGQLANKSVSQ